MYPMVRALVERTRRRFRRGRAELLVELLRPEGCGSILDLGGGTGSFPALIRDRTSATVTVADIGSGPFEARRRYGFRPVILREGEPLPFEDGEFDIVLCNSVIEHVTLPKQVCREERIAEREWRTRAFHRQRAFAREIRRVGRSYFVQTPHRHFPLELHTWLPFANWLTHDATRRLVRWTDRFWVKRCGCADWHLLTEAHMRLLFPDAEIHVERWIGLPKSIIAYRRGTARPHRADRTR